MSGKLFCSGTLVTETWVLTVTHCVWYMDYTYKIPRHPRNQADYRDNKTLDRREWPYHVRYDARPVKSGLKKKLPQPSEFLRPWAIQARMGSVYARASDSIGYVRNCIQIVCEPTFSGKTYSSVLCLLQLNRPFRLDTYIRLVQIEERGPMGNGTTCKLIGWGQGKGHLFVPQYGPFQLTALELFMKDLGYCHNFSNFDDATELELSKSGEEFFCSFWDEPFDYGSAVCQADAGSGVYCPYESYKISAIVIWTQSKIRCHRHLTNSEDKLNRAQYYVKIWPKIDWIHDVIRRYNMIPSSGRSMHPTISLEGILVLVIVFFGS